MSARRIPSQLPGFSGEGALRPPVHSHVEPERVPSNVIKRPIAKRPMKRIKR